MSQFPPHQPPPPPMMYQSAGCLVLALLLLTGCLLPLIFVDLAQTALVNLHLSPTAAILVLMGMILGSVINIPISRFPTDREVVVPVFPSPTGTPVFPQYTRLRHEGVIAVNLGGCVIPVLLAVRLSRHIVEAGSVAIVATCLGVIVNSLLCYRVAKTIPGLGIAIPLFVPASVALVTAWIGLPLIAGLLGAAVPIDGSEFRAPAAFIVGISGPLIGADLMHWPDFKKAGIGFASIGGAGTWDGIVLSGLLAALLA